MDKPKEHYLNLSLDNIVEEIDGVIHTEEWRDVIGYEGLYKISSFGRIRREFRLDKYGRSWDVIILKTFSSHKYRRVALKAVGKQPKKHQIHRLVANAFIENKKKSPQVNHINGCRHDNKISNLEWMTSSENHLHAFRVLGKKANTPNLGKKGFLSFRGVPVVQISTDGFVLDMFGSVAEACRLLRTYPEKINQYIGKDKLFNGSLLM